jgi:GNAT superfamily N-acetyltransferase
MAIITRNAEMRDLPTVRTLLTHLHDPPSEVAWSTALWGQILGDPNRTILLAESREEHPVGTADVLIVPSLTHGGAPWAMVENVVVEREWRSRGVGSALMQHATRIADDAGCHTVQLASSRRRPAAHHFYERLGFRQDALGYRLKLHRRAGAGAA